MRERCLLAGILGVGRSFPFHAPQPERGVVAHGSRRRCALSVAHVMDLGIIAGTGGRGIGIESLGIGGNSRHCFVCGRVLRNVISPVVRRHKTGQGLDFNFRMLFLCSRHVESPRYFVQSVIMKAIATILVLCSSLLVSAQTPTAKSAPAKTGAAHAAAGRPSLLNPASLKAKAPADFKVRFTTSAGDFVVEVHREWAPNGADRFYNLVRNGYFTNAAFFRVVSGFIVQFGLSADPAVNKAWKTATIQDDPVVQSNKRGNIVFAMAGPNTRTTQVFINFVDNARLDHMGFAPFGSVVEGMNVVDKIYPVYGEMPQQDLITEQGDAYLKAHFRDIDRIKTARIVPAVAPAAHAATGPKPAAKPSPKVAAKPAHN